MEIRDSMLDDIKENEYNYNKFINYWSKILDKYGSMSSFQTQIFAIF